MRIKLGLAVLVTLVASVTAHAECSSIAAASYGDWRPAKTAPRDGTVVEMLETYGVAPWYGIFKWARPTYTYTDAKGKMHTEELSAPEWVSVDKPDQGVMEDSCLFWRPYKKTGKYVDPTGGAQDSIAYWCAYSHRRYNKKKDACE